VPGPNQPGIVLEFDKTPITRKELVSGPYLNTNCPDSNEYVLGNCFRLQENFYTRLPDLPFITKLVWKWVWMGFRILLPRAYGELASRLPNVHAIDWDLRDMDGDFEWRIQFRKYLAAALDLVPESLRHFTLRYTGLAFRSTDGTHQTYHNGSGDPLSFALRKLSQRVDKMDPDCGIIIRNELFWDENSVSTLHWESF
jgi:hypothetical protein